MLGGKREKRGRKTQKERASRPENAAGAGGRVAGWCFGEACPKLWIQSDSLRKATNEDLRFAQTFNPSPAAFATGIDGHRVQYGPTRAPH